MGSLSYLPPIPHIDDTKKELLSSEERETYDRDVVDRLFFYSEKIEKHTELEALFQAFTSQVHRKENFYDFLCEKENQDILTGAGIKSFVVSHEDFFKKLTLYGDESTLQGPIYSYQTKMDMVHFYDIFFTKTRTQSIHSPQSISRGVHQSMTQLGV